MDLHNNADHQAALVKLKQLITDAPDDAVAIAALAEVINDYEIKAGHGPVRPDTLVGRLEIEMLNRQLNREQMAGLLEIPVSQFSDLLSGRREVDMELAKKLYRTLHIPAHFILETA